MVRAIRPTFDRIGRVDILVHHCRPGRHQLIDDALIRLGQAHLERTEIALPLLHGARSGDGAGDGGVCQDPGGGECHRLDAAPACMSRDRRCRTDGRGPELRLQHALVLCRCPAVGGRLCILGILAREHPTGRGAEWHDPDAEGGAGWQQLDLGRAVERMIERLAHDRPVDTQGVADGADPCGPPCLEVRQAEIADSPGPLQIGDGAHQLLERRERVLLMEVENVDEVGAEPPQARLRLRQDPFARQAASVRAGSVRVGELRRQDPMVAVGGNGATDDFLGPPARIGIGGVDQVDPGLGGRGDDAACFRLFGARAEHHRAEDEA